jgi:hypothetical protein
MFPTAWAAPSSYMVVSIAPDGADSAVQALAGGKQAQLDLGIRYEEGNGLPPDTKRARKLYRAASAPTKAQIAIGYGAHKNHQCEVLIDVCDETQIILQSEITLNNEQCKLRSPNLAICHFSATTALFGEEYCRGEFKLIDVNSLRSWKIIRSPNARPRMKPKMRCRNR